MTIQSSIIERIVELAIEDRLGAEKQAIEQDRIALSVDIYNRLVPPAVRDALATLHREAPSVWATPVSSIAVSGHEEAGDIILPEGAFRPFSGGPVASQHHFTLTPAEVARWRGLEERENQMRDRKWEIRDKLHAFVESFDTTAELIAAWPEGAHFVEQAVFNTSGTQTAYPKTEINALLGLG